MSTAIGPRKGARGVVQGREPLWHPRGEAAAQRQRVLDDVTAPARDVIAFRPGERVPREDREALARARTAASVVRHFVNGIDVTHFWPDRAHQELASGARVFNVEVRDPDLYGRDFRAISELLSAYFKTRLVFVVDVDHPGYQVLGRNRAEIEGALGRRFKELFPKAEPGREYRLVFQHQREDQLVAKIQERMQEQSAATYEPGSIFKDKDGSIRYWPSKEVDNPFVLISQDNKRVEGILLVDQDGRPTPEALEATRFFDAGNGDAVRLLISPENHKLSQDAVWELVTGLSTNPVPRSRYHELFGPFRDAARVATHLLREAQGRPEVALSDFGHDWDAVAYALKNFGHLEWQDRQIICTTIRMFQRLAKEGVIAASGMNSICGCINPYFVLLRVPYLKMDAALRFFAYHPQEREFMKWVSEGSPRDDRYEAFKPVEEAFQRIADEMAQVDPQYNGVFDRMVGLLQQPGSCIEFLDLQNPKELPKAFFIEQGFVTESMAKSFQEFLWLTYNLLESLEVGGHFQFSFMEGSSEYFDGNGGVFPQTDLSRDELELALRRLVGDGNFVIEEIPPDPNREGNEHRSMFTVYGVKTAELPDFEEVMEFGKPLSLPKTKLDLVGMLADAHAFAAIHLRAYQDGVLAKALADFIQTMKEETGEVLKDAANVLDYFSEAPTEPSGEKWELAAQQRAWCHRANQELQMVNRKGDLPSPVSRAMERLYEAAWSDLREDPARMVELVIAILLESFSPSEVQNRVGVFRELLSASPQEMTPAQREMCLMWAARFHSELKSWGLSLKCGDIQRVVEALYRQAQPEREPRLPPARVQGAKGAMQWFRTQNPESFL